jgi:hypothetical protein
MTLLVKDANSTVQPVSTQPDIAGNLAPVHVPASVIAGIATPVSAANPLPVSVAEGTVGVDGSGTIVSATVAQTLFAGVIPTTGFQISNNCSSVIYVRDTGSPAGPGAGMPVPIGGTYTTPLNYRPAGSVSVYGGTTSGNFEARRW